MPTTLLLILSPQFYHAQAGEPKAEWSVWKHEFKNYVVASGMNSLQDAHKKAILFYYMGVKLLKLHVKCVVIQTRTIKCWLTWGVIIRVKPKRQ